ncbi:MAG TPA: hypothetical protein EYO45_09450 [Candidatus Marinimicrobia bacterium]|nr:hypothetical protein [Nitrososphaerota archaeon]HIA80406.1 hypothetical protein [Candidatus Neomarinimicrobiota bacterium]HIB33308.1 hypothetical protein [Candidatus Neomarinimicrobiota bacterium]
MNFNNEQLPWYLIVGGGAVIVFHLILTIFSSLLWFDWLAFIAIIVGIGLLITDNSSGTSDNSD